MKDVLEMESELIFYHTQHNRFKIFRTRVHYCSFEVLKLKNTILAGSHDL